jgi:hypothetical protein
MKGDECASIFIRATHLICAFLGSYLHIEHVPRCSDWGSKTADNLSRQNTTGFLENRMLMRWSQLKIPTTITEWLKKPSRELGHTIPTTRICARKSWKIKKIPQPKIFLDFFGISHI